jgi:hypothetical protein
MRLLRPLLFAALAAPLLALSQGEIPRSPGKRVAIEYRASSGERYWITADPGEPFSRDYRTGDTVRTGARFGVWSREDAPKGAVAVCRFQGNAAYGIRSRFFTLAGDECEAVKRNPAWILEVEDWFFAMPPSAGGVCEGGSVPVTRFFSGGPDLNHRYVTSPEAAGNMRARRWRDEGTVMCARALESHE